ncbi:hypothetical protein GCM10027162_11570 [Streptomyces incanus]
MFVVAAGTVGSPGVADAALTVGAVDRDGGLAPFSSRGPRAGDDAVKPDLTAPGVGIVAARADGTTMGEPVDARHVAASGTSMATPHVAGAAALLAQRHPDWSAARLKDALVSTARTAAGQEATEQGGGLVDVAAAALGPVTATGTVALGPLQTGGGEPRTTRLRYTNTSGSDITLALTARLATAGGRPPGEGAVKLGSGSVRVPAGTTADVPLTVDPARVQQGDYYGYVTAVSGDGKVTVHTTVSLAVQGPTHRLTVRTVDLAGQRVEALPTIWGPDGFVGYTGTDPAVAEVEEGTYQLDYSSLDDAGDGQELRHVVLPEVKVTKDMTVTLDVRKTTLVDIRTPRPAEQRGILSYQTYRKIDGRSLLQGTMYFDVGKRLYVSPTSAVTDGTFEFASRWQFVAPLLEMKVSGGKGGEAEPDAYYMPSSPLFDRKSARLIAVDAGDAAAPDFSRARGKLAVLTNEQTVGERTLTERAAVAGVRGVVLVHFNDNAWIRWHPEGDRWGVPTVRIGAKAGAALLKRIGRGTTTVGFTGTARSPYLYDVMQVSSQRIPAKIVHTVSERNSAVVRSRYADNGGVPWASEQRFARRPYQDTAWLQYTRYVPTGFDRTEYVSSGDTSWQHLVHHKTTYDVDAPLRDGMADTPRTYRAGEHTSDTWQASVVRPSIPRGTTTPSVRKGDVLSVRIPEFTDSQAGHRSRLAAGGGGGGIGTRAAGDAAEAVLYRDGRQVGRADGGFADFEVPSDAADYRLDLTTSRTSPEWVYGTGTETSWSFRSGTAAPATTLPLLQLDYDVPVDAYNAVRPGRTHTVGLSVRAQDGLAAPRGVGVQVEVSYDDGRSWSRAGLMPGLKRHADALDLARAEATSLLEVYRDTMRRRDASELIEVITGAEALRQHLRQIQGSARDEMLWFCKAQYVAMPSGSNDSEFEALGRGVRYRVLYEKAFFDDEGAVDNVVAGVRAGEVARAVPHLPLRLAVADRAIAICPLVPGGPRGNLDEPTTALVRDSNLLAALIALFERYWEDAVPLDVDDSDAVAGTDGAGGPDPLSATDRRLLALLVSGVADKTVATQLGLSRRTVQRHIQHMMELAGAATRMQLAWQAARRGWL